MAGGMGCSALQMMVNGSNVDMTRILTKRFIRISWKDDFFNLATAIARLKP
jgi:hypothetical protein